MPREKAMNELSKDELLYSDEERESLNELIDCLEEEDLQDALIEEE